MKRLRGRGVASPKGVKTFKCDLDHTLDPMQIHTDTAAEPGSIAARIAMIGPHGALSLLSSGLTEYVTIVQFSYEMVIVRE